MKQAHIISVGNELLIGDTVNTNASEIGSFLTGLGFNVKRISTLPDIYDPLRNEISTSLQEADLTIITGGLGPTHDDITKIVVFDIFGGSMVTNDQVKKHIEAIFEKRGFVISAANLEQAMVPDTCDVLFNKKGTAPGMWFKNNGRYLAVLPGVPYEMKYLLEHGVHEKIQEAFTGLDVWVTEYFKTAGIPESTLSEQIGDLDSFVNNGVGVAYLPGPGGVTIRISASGKDEMQASEKLDDLKNLVNRRAGDYIYGKGKDTKLEEVIGKLLASRGKSIAIAESCTGGLVANRMTNIAGSSRYMNGGVVTYSNESKVKILNVSPDDIKSDGAVSAPVALQMAKNVAKLFNADIGVSTTGIAGPGGGTDDKPVGLVYMGFWMNGSHFALKTIFTEDRIINKKRSVAVVLDTVRRKLLGVDGTPYNLKPINP
jgi:nicotinamide-nucleotide amidase